MILELIVGYRKLIFQDNSIYLTYIPYIIYVLLEWPNSRLNRIMEGDIKNLLVERVERAFSNCMIWLNSKHFTSAE